MTVQIRTAEMGDYPALCSLFEEVDALHRVNHPEIFQKPVGPVRDIDYYRALVSDEDIGLFVAEAENQVVGFVHVITRDSPPIPIFVPRRFAIVDNLAVSKNFQRKGIGQKLMDTAQYWAADKGATSIELNVYHFNQKAISFYENMGYKPTSQRMSKALSRS